MVLKFSTLAGGVYIMVGSDFEIQDTVQCFRFYDEKVEVSTVGNLKLDASKHCWVPSEYKYSDFQFA